MRTNGLRWTRALAAATFAVGLAASWSPAPALAQTAEPQVQEDTYYDAERGVAASCAAVGGGSGTVIVTGHAVAPGAVAIRLSCGIVQYGRVVSSFTSALPGSVSATGGTRTVAAGPWTVCLEFYAYFADGSERRYNGCGS